MKFIINMNIINAFTEDYTDPYSTSFMHETVGGWRIPDEDKDENEDVDYINCKWLKTRTLINLQFLEIVYCVSNCPSGDVIHNSERVNYYREDEIVEYKRIGSTSISTWDLMKVTSYTYEEI